MSITAVIFDVGGVLLDWQPRHLYSKLIDDPAELDRFLTEICPLDWHYQHDQGVPFSETLPARSAEFPDHADLIGVWGDRYLEMTAGEIDGSAELIEDLIAAGIQVYGLSNMPASVWPDLLAAWPVLQRLSEVVISGAELVVKPHPEIFELALDRFGLVAADTVFVDDSAANVAGADAVGMTGVVFTSAAGLRSDLAALGVAIPTSATT